MDNATTALIQLLDMLRVQVTPKTIEKTLENHPDFPSLLSISDVLTDWGIDNVGYKTSQIEIKNITPPFIAHIAGNKFVVVKEVANEHVLVLDKKNKLIQVSNNDFIQSFTGNFLQVNPTKKIDDPNYSKNRLDETLALLKTPFIIIGAIIILLTSLVYYSDYFSSLKIQSALLSLTLLSGFIISILLLIQSIDSNNPLVQKLCKVVNSNCKLILGSNAAKLLWGYLSWAEIGFFYFSGSLLLFLFNSTNSAALQFLSLINLLALPYTFYSIYYQKYVAKQWCALCSAIQIILWLEFFILFEYSLQPFPLAGEKAWLIKVFIFYLSPMFFWFFIKPHLLQSKLVNPLKEQLKEFKNNFQIFHTILKNQDKFPLPSEEDSLIMGDLACKKVITIVTNPYCSVCEKAQETLEEWISKYGNFKLQIVFAIDEVNIEVRKFANHLYSLESSSGKNTVFDALSTWHSEKRKDFEKWASKYPTDEKSEVHEKLNRNADWCRMIRLEYTPAILINGYKIPPFYELDQIKYFLMYNQID